MGMEPIPMNGTEATLVASLASGLRHTDPARRAEFAERLVAALDRNGYAIEMLVMKAIANPVALSMKPSTSRPMGQYNWLTWVRDMLTSPLLTEWEAAFLRKVMQQSFPSAKQKQKLWEILHKVYPAGCGRWGKPN